VEGAGVIKLIAMVKRCTDIDVETFRVRWCDEHPDFVRRMPGVAAYRQNLARGRDPVYDGVAEVWFPDRDTMRAAFESPEGAAAREHERTFAGDVQALLAEEITYGWGTG
jgi:uncharacterized protein (TIGR02118 family)